MTTSTQAIVEELRDRLGDGPFGVTYEGLIAVRTKAAGYLSLTDQRYRHFTSASA